MTVALLACLLVLVGLGLVERCARDRAWRQVPVRIHVNGIRGKSTVTRLIWSALREAGISTVGKTTGTAARVLLPDGSEKPVVRRARASIREQLTLLRAARRLHAQAVVAECMALDPELQWLSERKMLRATIGVITNVRLDHTEIMGADLDTIAETLANTIPKAGLLVAGEDRFLPLFQARAARLKTEVIGTAGPLHDLRDRLPGPEVPSWLMEDMAVALAVTRRLGICDEVALRGFAAAPPDPGTARSGSLHVKGRRLHWLDATAANDPHSLGLLTTTLVEDAATVAGSPLALVYNHRADRAARLACFAAHSALLARADRLVVTGARPPWSVWRALRRARGGAAPAQFVASRALVSRLLMEADGTRLIFCGNTLGIDVPHLLEELGSDG